jgi:hypothetical protein
VIRALLCALLGAACGQTSQTEVTYPIVAHGVAPAAIQAGDWSVTLEVAEVGFGPLYLCSTAAASSDLCPAALAEYIDTATIDLLDPAAQPLGDINGVTGEIRSATWDYGVTWLATQTEATPQSGAPGGHSAHFEGSATDGVTTIRFVADVDALPLYRGTRTVQGTQVSADVTDDRVELDVDFDVAGWWSRVDIGELVDIGGDPVVVPSDSRAHSALVLQMTTNATPTFTWTPR